MLRTISNRPAPHVCISILTCCMYGTWFDFHKGIFVFCSFEIILSMYTWATAIFCRSGARVKEWQTMLKRKWTNSNYYLSRYEKWEVTFPWNMTAKSISERLEFFFGVIFLLRNSYCNIVESCLIVHQRIRKVFKAVCIRFVDLPLRQRKLYYSRPRRSNSLLSFGWRTVIRLPQNG